MENMAFIESMLAETESPHATKGEALAALSKAVLAVNRELIPASDPDLVRLSRSDNDSRLERVLERLEETSEGIARKFDAKEFSISVGFPAGVSVTFTWAI